jgi:sialic acid synthase SpsE
LNCELTKGEVATRAFRRSWFMVEDIEAGDSFSEKNARLIRPGYGLPPKHPPEVLGPRATCDISRGTPLDWSLASTT